MALSSSERVKRLRDRKKAEREAELLEAQEKLHADFRMPFGEYYFDHGGSDDVGFILALAGYEEPDFNDDRGPEAFALEGAIAGLDEPFPSSKGALGRAETLVGLLIDAATELAGIVSDYKKTEIKARIAEVEASDLSDAVTRKVMIAEIVRLNKILDQLNKRYRRDLPQWQAKGFEPISSSPPRPEQIDH